MQKIENLILDLGGVLLDIDFSKTDEAFATLGLQGFKKFFSQHNASPLFEDLETGTLTPEDFYNQFRLQTGMRLTNEQIEKAWNALLGRFLPEKIEWLKKIKKKYKVYLFSNTNLIHYNAFQKNYNECIGNGNFNDHFIKSYYSHELGLRKPHASAFIQLLKLENLKAGDTLFIDDTASNIEGAKQAGMQTILLLPPATVFDLNL